MILTVQPNHQYKRGDVIYLTQPFIKNNWYHRLYRRIFNIQPKPMKFVCKDVSQTTIKLEHFSE